MTRETTPDKSLNAQFSESLHNMRFALLGAYGMARKESGKLAQALIDEGKRRQDQTRLTAEAQLDEARQQAESLYQRAENLLEVRLERTLKALGVATHEDVQALNSQVERLTRQVNKLHKSMDAKKATEDANAA